MWCHLILVQQDILHHDLTLLHSHWVVNHPKLIHDFFKNGRNQNTNTNTSNSGNEDIKSGNDRYTKDNETDNGAFFCLFFVFFPYSASSPKFNVLFTVFSSVFCFL